MNVTKIMILLILIVLMFICGNEILIRQEINNLKTIMVVAAMKGGYDDIADRIVKSDTLKPPEQTVLDFIIENTGD